MKDGTHYSQNLWMIQTALGHVKVEFKWKSAFDRFFFFFFLNHVVNEFHYKFHWDVIFGELSAWRNANDYGEGNDTENVN